LRLQRRCIIVRRVSGDLVTPGSRLTPRQVKARGGRREFRSCGARRAGASPPSARDAGEGRSFLTRMRGLRRTDSLRGAERIRRPWTGGVPFLRRFR